MTTRMPHGVDGELVTALDLGLPSDLPFLSGFPSRAIRARGAR